VVVAVGAYKYFKNYYSAVTMDTSGMLLVRIFINRRQELCFGNSGPVIIGIVYQVVDM
jgi:hypothetical protein